jgi:hypothetical protein
MGGLHRTSSGHAAHTLGGRDAFFCENIFLLFCLFSLCGDLERLSTLTSCPVFFFLFNCNSFNFHLKWMDFEFLILFQEPLGKYPTKEGNHGR